MENKKERSKKISKFKGVAYHKPNRTWRARYKKDGIRIELGYYKEEIDAAYAYLKALCDDTGIFEIKRKLKEKNRN